MLPNELFALACRAYYDEEGFIVDASNGEFAHCPYPEGMGDSGYHLLHDHHQQQGLLQSKDVDQCCFFIGHAKKWLLECDPIPENYFELWDIYEKYSKEHLQKNAALTNAKLHEKRDDLGRSLHTLKLHEEKDELGRSLLTLRLNEQKDEFGKSINAVKGGRAAHEEKDENGKSVNAVKASAAAHREKDNLGRSIQAVKNAERLHKEKDKRGKSLHAVNMGSKGGKAFSKPVIAIRGDGERMNFPSIISCANQFGVSESAVRTWVRGKYLPRGNAKGWKFVWGG